MTTTSGNFASLNLNLFKTLYINSFKGHIDFIDVWHIDLTEKPTNSQFFLQQILSRYLAQSPEELVIERGGFGKPYLRDFSDWQFNLSHSNEKMLIAVSYKHAIGIDIELVKPRKSMNGLVKKCFALSEQNYWHDLPESEKVTTFYDFWTRKEAVVKGIGRGIALGLNQCVIDVSNPQKFLSLPVDDVWQTYSLEISPNYRAAFAINSRNPFEITHKTFIHE